MQYPYKHVIERRNVTDLNDTLLCIAMLLQCTVHIPLV